VSNGYSAPHLESLAASLRAIAASLARIEQTLAQQRQPRNPTYVPGGQFMRRDGDHMQPPE
jgi:hypothetical protein